MSEEDLELEFIAGKFWHELPKEKRWLLKYFREKRGQAFVMYFLTFNNYYRFRERTGYYFNKYSMWDLKTKLLTLLAAHEKAKASLDFETLTSIETGKYKWKVDLK